MVDDLAREGAALFLAVRPRTVALAGGATPRRLYERLAQLDHPWGETDVCFGDERCVPPDHPDSNFRMAHEALFSRVRARVHRMHGETCDPARYEEELASIFDSDPPRFDLVFLGLGADGHTASLFPGDPALDERERWVVRVEREDHARLTVTLPVLSAAKTAVFLVSGEAKREALRLLMACADIPAARVAADRVIVLADRAAAGGVS
ncbi:MAG: 6-phosphogluconolactonase [Dehalococcoidia bacterium]